MAGALLFLPHYYEQKVDLAEKLRTPRRPSGLDSDLPSGGFRYVTSIRRSGQPVPNTILSYAPREFAMESSGRWKALSAGSIGRGPHGEPVRNRTWIDDAVTWRDSTETHRTIYVKSTLSEAKLKIVALGATTQNKHTEADVPCLYVLRCAVMEAGVYKIGWTTGTAEERSRELSSATGVPLAFVVVRSHKHPRARELEAGVHAVLAPYRVNDAREFFRVNIDAIDAAVDSELQRISR